MYRAFQAFIRFQGGTNPAGFYIDVANPTALTLNAIPTVTVVTRDFMVVSNCIVVVEWLALISIRSIALGSFGIDETGLWSCQR